MNIRFFEEKDLRELESKIEEWANRWNHEIVQVSLTTNIIGYSNYIVACVVYK